MKKYLSCPICLSKNTKFAFFAKNIHGNKTVSLKEKFSYYECLACNAVFLANVLFTKKYYEKYYNFKGYYRKSSPIVSLIESVLNRTSFIEKEKVILSNVTIYDKKVKLLDVGAGEGEFLTHLDKIKFDSIGIEIDKKSYLSSQRKGAKMILGDVLRHDFRKEKFDVITLWHVIEHVPDPKALIKKLKSILKNNGIIIVSTPNTNSFGYHLAKGKWYHTDAPRHVILYNEKCLQTLSKLTKVIVTKTGCDKYEFPLDLFWSSKGIVRIFSLFFKLFDKETIICALKK